MKILTARQTREADAYTIQHEPIPSINLMERASQAFVNVFLKKISKKKQIKIFCGPGNNGGDGLAISRMLLKQGYKTETFVIKQKSAGTSDFNINYERLSKLTNIKEINQSEQIPAILSKDVIVDGIFGSGLARAVSGLYGEIIDAINNSKAEIISIDIASGLFADEPVAGGSVIRPKITITFQMPKIAYFIPENAEYTGEWIVADIGLNQDFIDAYDSPYHLTDEAWLKNFVLPRKKFSHKGDFGRVIMLAGSYGKMGAAVLASRACLKSGAGLLTVHIPKVGYEIMQISVPEAMTTIDSGPKCLEGYPGLSDFDTLALGPGIGIHQNTVSMMGKLLENWKNPLVIDADGLNILAKNKELLVNLAPGSILTPHLKEFERIAGECKNQFERIEKQINLSNKYQIIIVLKGAYSSISMPDGSLYFNSTGNPGMATGGSGDVLTGIITGILAQKYSPENSALLGVYLHGLAGDFAAKELGQESLIASDIIRYLPQAFEKIMS